MTLHPPPGALASRVTQSYPVEQSLVQVILQRDILLSSAELRHVLTKTGRMKLTEEEVTEMIAEVDEDQDGKINFNELVKLFTGADSIRDLVTGRENKE